MTDPITIGATIRFNREFVTYQGLVVRRDKRFVFVAVLGYPNLAIVKAEYCALVSPFRPTTDH